MSYSFLYPLQCLAGKEKFSLGRWLALARCAALRRLRLLRSASDDVLQINALSIEATGTKLYLDGPCLTTSAAWGELAVMGRAQALTLGHLYSEKTH